MPPPEPTPVDPPPIAYAPAPPAVTRRGFRLLLLLTFVNAVLLGLTAAGPTVNVVLKQQWTDYQARRATRAAAA